MEEQTITLISEPLTSQAENQGPTLNIKAVSQDEYDTLKHYYKYACASYHILCPRPNGQHLVTRFTNLITDTQGFVVRDDDREEIIVALRGSTMPVDFIIDAQVLLVPFSSHGVTPPDGVRVHLGFMVAWNSVASEVVNTVREELKRKPSYGIVTAGHSLGGSLSLLAALTLQLNFPNNLVKTYSFGAPRTGNKEFAQFVRNTLGTYAHRVVHTNDGVPTMIPTILGYRHHGVEYWLNPEPCCAENTTRCLEEEDPEGSASLPSKGINLAHTLYFGIVAGTPFCH